MYRQVSKTKSDEVSVHGKKICKEAYKAYGLKTCTRVKKYSMHEQELNFYELF